MLRAARPMLMVAPKVMVLGGGTMGAGIAQVAAAAGRSVSLVDLNEGVLTKSQAGIQRSLGKVAARKFKEQPQEADQWVQDTMGRISFTTEANKAAKESDLIIEAIVEDMAVKKKVWAQLDEAAPRDTLFASNTSSLKIGEMAAATSRADRFGGLHFFSPVPMMKLVEVINAEGTSQETGDKLFQFSKEIGKTPIRCKDTKGFVVNRLLVPLLMEAIRMVERGDASIEDIDTAMKLGAGHPMGPLELSDAVGNDVTNAIIQGWHRESPDETLFNPSPLLSQMVADNKLGLKSGGGFYTKSAQK